MNTFDESMNWVSGGNYGLMDQQLAIKFIKQNAENIGGDPKKINLAGTSSGGQAVAYQLLHSETNKMIRAAFSQSGVAMFDFSSQRSPHANMAIKSQKILSNGYVIWY